MRIQRKLHGFVQQGLCCLQRVNGALNAVTLYVLSAGSLDSEAGIYALGFDVTGSRLVTCEADKTIKMWREDDKATPETHPIHFKPPKEMRRF